MRNEILAKNDNIMTATADILYIGEKSRPFDFDTTYDGVNLQVIVMSVVRDYCRTRYTQLYLTQYRFLLSFLLF